MEQEQAVLALLEKEDISLFCRLVSVKALFTKAISLQKV